MAKDYYGILGVRRDASADDIKRAYRQLARAVPSGRQPRSGGAREVQGDQRRVRGALRPEEARDRRPRRRSAGARAVAGAAAAPGPFVGFQDIMDAFFGNATARGPRPRTSRRRRRDPAARARPARDRLRRRGADQRRHRGVCARRAPAPAPPPGTHPTTCETCGGRGEIQSVQRTFLGQVVSARPCPACQGYGTLIPTRARSAAATDGSGPGATCTVKIPAGVEDGMRIRLAQQGEVGPGGGPAGDLYVEIHERPHDIFSRKGDDLHCRVTVPMTARRARHPDHHQGARLRGDASTSARAPSPAPSLRIRRQGASASAWHRPRRPARASRRPHADRAAPPTRSGRCASSPGPAGEG